jgi:hypothetical protein
MLLPWPKLHGTPPGSDTPFDQMNKRPQLGMVKEALNVGHLGMYLGQL